MRCAWQGSHGPGEAGSDPGSLVGLALQPPTSPTSAPPPPSWGLAPVKGITGVPGCPLRLRECLDFTSAPNSVSLGKAAISPSPRRFWNVQEGLI